MLLHRQALTVYHKLILESSSLTHFSVLVYYFGECHRQTAIGAARLKRYVCRHNRRRTNVCSFFFVCSSAANNNDWMDPTSHFFVGAVNWPLVFVFLISSSFHSTFFSVPVCCVALRCVCLLTTPTSHCTNLSITWLPYIFFYYFFAVVAVSWLFIVFCFESSSFTVEWKRVFKAIEQNMIEFWWIMQRYCPTY